MDSFQLPDSLVQPSSYIQKKEELGCLEGITLFFAPGIGDQKPF